MTERGAVRLHLPDADATGRLATALAMTAPTPAVVYLQGDLGAGKSTLARAWLRALGVQGAVRSPTYTLVERYPVAGGAEALHLDLYRIGDAGELEFLGLDSAGVALWLVEWAERGGRSLPAADWWCGSRSAAPVVMRCCRPTPGKGTPGSGGSFSKTSCGTFLPRGDRKCPQAPDS